jgi:DNA-binding HxlR family transcriptional regulator
MVFGEQFYKRSCRLVLASLLLFSQMKHKTSTLRGKNKCWCGGRAAFKNHQCLCSANGLVQIIGRKYSLSLISLIAARGRIRFSDIRSEMDDISRSTLSNRLAEFVRAGLIHRQMFRMTPPRVEYALTNEGERLRRGLLSLAQPHSRPSAHTPSSDSKNTSST